jgi:glycosyltransferase involved in cell wall biosynthesis
MKIFYDAQAFAIQRYGGVSKYFSELVRELAGYDDLSIKVGCIWTQNQHLRGVLAATEWDGRSRGAARLNRAYDRFARIGSDIIHSTFYDPRSLIYVRNKRHVVTVHDMIPERFPELFRVNPHLAKREYCKQADLIICVSQQTRKDLMAFYNIDPKKVVTIHLGVRTQNSNGPSTGTAEDDRYVLFVGNRHSYKNFKIVLEALRILAETDKSISLRLAGGGQITDQERYEIERCGLRGRVSHVQVDDVSIRALYRNALCFVFPSLYEGFGLPMLEAFAEGCPVILADNPCFREIAGDAAIYFDPKDTRACASAIERGSAFGPERDAMIGLGLELASHYTWAKSASQHVEAYSRVVTST